MDFVNSILGRQPQQAPVPDEDTGKAHHTTPKGKLLTDSYS
jgi:hypothetical protein